ncbi:MAG TPA: polysaccharide biosynthesis/export family protein [Gemmatimonadaceae bacterium]|nr:polysaccharide biosynthesis/export family protein [Gemmatimonadaceae bacterium]
MTSAVALGALAPRAARAQDTTSIIGSSRNVGVMRAGDVLDIVVYREREMSGKYLIDSRGIVQIPGLGDITAAGFTPTEIKQRLSDQLIRRGVANPEIAVSPLIRVSVLGEVRTPGLHPVDPGTTLIQLLTISGGPTDRADMRRAYVVRETQRFPVDLASALAGSATGRVVLYSNDVLVVPKRGGLTRENISFGLTALGALLSIATLVVTLQNQ